MSDGDRIIGDNVRTGMTAPSEEAPDNTPLYRDIRKAFGMVAADGSTSQVNADQIIAAVSHALRLARESALRGRAAAGDPRTPERVWLWRVKRDYDMARLMEDEEWTEEPDAYPPECLVGEYVLARRVPPGRDTPTGGDT